MKVREKEIIKLDSKDKEILMIIEHNAKIPPKSIADMVDLNVEEVEKRILELEKKKVIVQYKTIINWEKTTEDVVYAFIDVRVTPERELGFDAVAERIFKFPEVHSLYLMSGTYDFSVVIEGKSMKEIAYFVAEKLATIEQVQGTVTHFVLKKYKVDGMIVEPQEKSKRLPFTP